MTPTEKYAWLAAGIGFVMIGSVAGVRATIRHLHPYPTVDSLSGPAIDDYWCGRTITLDGTAAADSSSTADAAPPTYHLVSAQGRQLTVESDGESGVNGAVGHRLVVKGQLVCQYLLSDTPFVFRFVEAERKSLD